MIKKSLLTAALISIFFILISRPGGTVHAADVQFADSDLELLIHEQLEIPEGNEITSDDMLNLTKVDYQAKNISSLVGLEYATNLEEVNFSNPEV